MSLLLKKMFFAFGLAMACVSCSSKKVAGDKNIGGITEGDENNIKAQICRHWIVPAGVRDAESMKPDISFELRDNGEVIVSSIVIVDERRYRNDPAFRAIADSAKQAILQASPLDIPKDKIGLLREITLRFDMEKATK